MRGEGAEVSGLKRLLKRAFLARPVADDDPRAVRRYLGEVAPDGPLIGRDAYPVGKRLAHDQLREQRPLREPVAVDRDPHRLAHLVLRGWHQGGLREVVAQLKLMCRHRLAPRTQT